MEMSVTNLEKLLENGPGKRLSYHLGCWGENLKNWDFDAISELYQLSKMLQQYSVKSMCMLQNCPLFKRMTDKIDCERTLLQDFVVTTLSIKVDTPFYNV